MRVVVYEFAVTHPSEISYRVSYFVMSSGLGENRISPGWHLALTMIHPEVIPTGAQSSG